MGRFANSLLWITAIMGIGLAIGYLFWPQFVKHEELKRAEKSLHIRVEAEETKNARLRREENDLKTDPNYVEKVAREKLGLVKPGELIYKFEEDKQN